MNDDEIGAPRAWWGQLAALGATAVFVAMVPAGMLGAVACEAVRVECAVSLGLAWGSCAAVVFAIAVRWGSGRMLPQARQRLAGSMLGFSSVPFLVAVLVHLAVGASFSAGEWGWYGALGAAYGAASASAAAGAHRGGRVVGPAALSVVILGALPSALLPVHGAFGVLVSTPVVTVGLGLALAAALTSSWRSVRSPRRSASG